MDETRTQAYRAVMKTLKEPYGALLRRLDLSWYSTLYRLPPEIGELSDLRELTCEGSPIRDLTPIRKLTGLELLDLDGTLVSDLEPLVDMTGMQDAAVRDPEQGGLSYARTPVAETAPFDQLARLRQPARTVETINEIRRRVGLPEHFPVGYSRSERDVNSPEGGDATIAAFILDFLKGKSQPVTIEEIRSAFRSGNYRVVDKSMRGELSRLAGSGEIIRLERGTYLHPNYSGFMVNQDDPAEQLSQRPASHTFSLRRGRIEAQPQSIAPRFPDIAADIRDEVGKKAREAGERLSASNAPRRMIATIERLSSSLGSSLEDIRAGVLQMRFRSLEADLAAYDTEEGRRELAEDALAVLRDLTSSVEDLMGCFPQLAEIEAERLAQRLKDADVPQVIGLLSEIREVAEGSEAVAPSAVEALSSGESELAHDKEIIEGAGSEVARAAAIVARDRTVGLMLLAYRNFVASTVKAGGELAGLGTDTWKEIRKDGPSQLSSAAVALAIAALVHSLLGPIAAAGAFAASFKPLRARAKSVVDTLGALRKKKPDAGAKSKHKLTLSDNSKQ